LKFLRVLQSLLRDWLCNWSLDS